MGDLCRAFDWSSTSLGDPEGWPQSLRTIVSVVLTSRFPMLLWWSDELVQIYNDAYRPSLGNGNKHPSALGQKAEYCWPEIWHDIAPMIDQVRDTGEATWSEDHLLPIYRNRRLEDVYWTFSYSPVMGEDGNIDGVLVVCHETTPKVKILNELTEREQGIRAIIEDAPVPIAVYTGPEMKIELANPTILQIWGKGNDVIGKSYFDILPELINQEIFEQLNNVFTTGNPYHAKNQYLEIVVNGKRQAFYFNYSFTPLYDKRGNVYGVMNTAADVTDLNLAKRKIEESETKFRSLIEQAPIATCLFTGPEMVIEVANELMIKMWGKGNTVIGRPLGDALPELRESELLNILDTVYKTGIAYENTDFPVELVIDGIRGTYYFDFTYKPILNADGKVYAIMDMAIDVTDNVIAKQRIEEQQRQLLSLFEQTTVGIAILSKTDLTFTMANPFYGDLIGRKTEDIIGKTLLEAIPELNGQGFDKLLYDVIESGIPYIANEVSVDLVHNGKLDTYYVDLAYQPYRENNAISGVFVIATDVTQQVLSRKNVELSESKLRSIISSAPAGIGLFVGRDLIVDVPNQMFIDIVGKGSDIVGKPLREIMPELVTHGQPFLQILDDVFTTGKMYQSYGDQVKIVHDGVMTYNYYNITYSPLFDEKGQVYAILDIAIDVTESVRSRQKLEDAESSLRDVIEMAELSTWKLDIKNNIFSYSPRFMEWLGLSGEPIKYQEDAFNPIPMEHRKRVEQAIQEVIKPGSTGIYRNEHPIINHQSGEIRIIHAHAQVFYDSEGNPQELRGSAQDITKQKELQEKLSFQVKKRTEQLEEANNELADANQELQKSNSELAQFAYIASHDLQEPVRKISTFVKMLDDSLSNVDERSKSYINRIQVSAERMTNLIKDILGFSQLSKENDGFKTVDLNEIVDAVLLDYDLIIEQKQAVVHYSCLPIVEAIPIQMSQLFGNLISNSLKYSHQGIRPVITITTTLLPIEERLQHHINDPDRIYYKIELRDNGIGFDQEYAKQIFNIFQRLHPKTEYAGTGIGLAMCKKIMQNHHGDIYAIANEKEGAAFIVILPKNRSL